MKKQKTQKGITLVALIITIVVLLILAMVAIGAVQDSKIIGHAQNAATDYDAKQKEEERLLAQYETLLDEQMGIGPWKEQEDGTIKNGKTGDTVEIGDELDNDDVLAKVGGTKSTYTGTWTILGVENGRLKLVSTSNVTNTDVALGTEDENVYVKDENGNSTTTLKPEIVEMIDMFSESKDPEAISKAIWSYLHTVETLNEYAKISTGIISARSITEEDIEAKEVLNITEKKKKELDDNYGKTYNFTYDGGARGIFVNEEGKIIVLSPEKNEIALNYTAYEYISVVNDTKFVNYLGNSNYWIASCSVSLDSYDAAFRVKAMYMGSMVSNILFRSSGGATYETIGVRAIVYI